MTLYKYLPDPNLKWHPDIQRVRCAIARELRGVHRTDPKNARLLAKRMWEAKKMIANIWMKNQMDRGTLPEKGRRLN